jgi:F-box-like
MLPDDVLLRIFDFFMEERRGSLKVVFEEWHTLVHVCHRWRSLAFGSPRRLNLCLVCSDKTPARDTLDVWPALPLFIRCNETVESVDNIVAVLEHSDRVCDIYLDFKGSDLEKISAAMQVPFLELTSLWLWSNGKMVSALPDSFLGGSAPRLERLELSGIPFPGLPKLLLSATNLDSLHLYNISHSGYIPPETIVTALSTLTRLESLSLRFESPQSLPDPAHQHPPPPTRSVLTNLRRFSFKGDSEYLEVVVAHIDAPQLFCLDTTLFNDIVFDTPQLTQFISRTQWMKALEKARVTFEGNAAAVELSSLTSGIYDKLEVRILCRELDWQVSSMVQVCTSCLPSQPTLDLHIDGNPHYRQHWQANVENALWLRLLHPFTSVENLYLSEEIARRIVPALQDLVGERATEVLPALENIFLEEGQRSGPVQEGIQQVVAVRQATNHPIAVSYQPKLSFYDPFYDPSVATEIPAQLQSR